MSTSNSVTALLTALVALGCSGERHPPDARTPTMVLVDDMERESGRIAWTPENPGADALPGRWISYADVQCDDLSPVPEWAPGGGWSYTELPEPVETLPGVVSENGARLATLAPLVNTWGAGMGFELSEPPLGSSTTRVTRPCSNGAQQDL